MSTPCPHQERLELVDALRGAALFGVLLVNMLWFAGFDNTLNEAQVAALTAPAVDQLAETAIDLLFFAKSIGIFTFLFGFGFLLQIHSLRQRDVPGARRVYARRMTGLLALGLAHWVFLWSGEILHVYAIGGFVLLAMERWRTRTLVIVGLLVALLARPVLGRALALLTTGIGTGFVPGDVQLGYRFDTFMSGGLVDVVRIQMREDILPQILTGVWFAAVVHALGRFMVGFAVAREGWLQHSERYRPQLAVLVVAGIAVGLFAQRDWLLRDWLNRTDLVVGAELNALLGHVFNSLGVLAMTAAYIAGFALAWQCSPARRALMLLVPIGRTALTSYLLQTPLCYLLFCGFGLGLMGRVGPAGCFMLSVLLFVAQVALSHVWLRHFRMGPVEWIWRWWTYRARPPLRRSV
ncbi:MAG TPA: DUF418 domain-containing protein [Steroidobacteraceae bacterium]|nr:DUF418 domain-containing protein [Steroidobacteraceae bacterium]